MTGSDSRGEGTRAESRRQGPQGVRSLADDVVRRIGLAEDRSVPVLRSVRRQVSKDIASVPGEEVLQLAEELLERDDAAPRWLVYELIHHHPGAMDLLDAEGLDRLGRGMSSWGEVDPFGCYLSGVVWRRGQIEDDVVLGWAASDDRWWRRTALVSTVALNNRARGGSGDADRTLKICDALRADRDDMVVKALSWALRELAKRDPEIVARYVRRHRDELAPRVVREVGNKLATGRKNPPPGAVRPDDPDHAT